MRIDVSLIPAVRADLAGKVCVVVDVLRFTSTLATMFGRGLEQAFLARSVAEARRLAQEHEALLCGERRGLAPPGFDHGNSPAEFDRLDLRGRSAVITTSNGTAAIARAARCAAVLAGSLLNLRATTRAAAREAQAADGEIALVCAGNEGRFSLEDAFCAGAFVAELQRRSRGRSEVSSSAIAALRLYRSYRGSALAAFRESEHGASLAALGFEGDLRFCAQRDRLDVVPRLDRAGPGGVRVVGR